MRQNRWALGLALAALSVIGLAVAPGAVAQDAPVVSLGDASGLERDLVSGSVFVPVFLSHPADTNVVVSFHTVNGTATAGTDYQRWGTPTTPRTLTIPAGAQQSTINVPVLPDAVVEPDETFSVVISSITGNATAGNTTGSATIVDSDGLSGPNPVITVSSGSVIEGDVGERRAQFHVHLSRAPASNVTITFSTANGTAQAGQDYAARLPGTVVFAPGQISKTVDVVVLSDNVVDSARSFSLEVAVTGGSPLEEVQTTGTATILDDDAPPATTTTTTTLPPAPIVATWALAGTPGPVPALVPLRWSISDPSGGVLTCRIDGTDDGVFEIEVLNCPATGSRNVSINAAGTSTARIRVESTSGRWVESTRWVTTSADPVESFDVQFRGIGQLAPAVAAAFTDAEQRLEAAIIRGVPDASGLPARPACLPAGSPDLPPLVDDVLIDVVVQPIDGAGGILGQAGPNCLRPTSFLPIVGQMLFDSQDVDMLMSDGRFPSVVLHEMAHVLGYGTTWEFLNVATGVGGTDPRYIGGRGVAEWSALGGAGNVPLENTGNPGTRDNHWRESVFGSELMTGFLNPGTNPFSRLSIGSFADLGYQVNVDSADQYSLPPPLAGLRSGVPLELNLLRPTPGTP